MKAMLEPVFKSIAVFYWMSDPAVVWTVSGIDQQEEYTVLRECAILGIPTICLIDTNCDPDLADISIPANDDAVASIRLILTKLVSAICEGRSSYIKKG